MILYCTFVKTNNRIRMKTVKLITCNDAMQAHILQGALRNEGIESLLHNENFSTLMKSYISNIAGVDIFVLEEDYDKAVQVLKDNQSWEEELTLCPYCGSLHIRFVLKKGKKIRAFAAAALSLLSQAPPGSNHWEYVCNECRRRFEKPVSRFESSDKTQE